MRKVMRKIMRKIVSIHKTMCKIISMRKMMRNMMRKMKILSSEGEYSRSEQHRTFECHLLAQLPVELKDFFSELGPSGFKETTPNGNLGPFPVSTDEHTFSY